MKRSSADKSGASASSSGSGTDKKRKEESSGGLGPYFEYIAAGLAAVALLAVYTVFVKPGAEAAPSVTSLTEATFSNFVTSNPDGALVYFYMDSCGHCKELTPEYEKAAVEIKAAGGAPFATANADDVPTLTKKFSIDRYPTMLWFRKGENVLELGPTVRKQDKLVEYVNWASQPTIIEFETVAEFLEAVPTLRETLRGDMAPIVVGFEGAKKHYENVELVSEKLRGKVAFLFVREAHPDGTALKTFANSEKDDQEYVGGFETDSVYAWANKFYDDAKAKRKSKADEEKQEEKQS